MHLNYTLIQIYMLIFFIFNILVLALRSKNKSMNLLNEISLYKEMYILMNYEKYMQLANIFEYNVYHSFSNLKRLKAELSFRHDYSI